MASSQLDSPESPTASSNISRPASTSTISRSTTRGDPHDLPWKVYPAAIGGDPMGAQRLPWLVEKQKPDLVFIVGNLPRIEAYMKASGGRAASIPVVVYSPVEREPIPLEQVGASRGVDRLFFYTEFAKREFEKALAQSGDETFTDIRVIPHGVETSTFFPFEQLNFVYLIRLISGLIRPPVKVGGW